MKVANNFDIDTNLSASTVMRLIPAFKAADMDEKREFMDAFISYVSRNYNGENNKGIRAYSNKIIEALNEMFRTFLWAYITQAKLYYKEKR